MRDACATAGETPQEEKARLAKMFFHDKVPQLKEQEKRLTKQMKLTVELAVVAAADTIVEPVESAASVPEWDGDDPFAFHQRDAEEERLKKELQEMENRRKRWRFGNSKFFVNEW